MTSAAGRVPKAGWGEQHDLTVAEAGALTLPHALSGRLGLAPGDLLSVEPGPVSLRLEIYRELLAADWEGLSSESAWRCVEEFLGRPLTAVLAGGRLPIPADLLPLARGDRVVLQVVGRGLFHDLFVFRAGGDAGD